MKIISVFSSKGGVGKSTVSANLCATLSQRGQRVLAVDLDPTNTLRYHFGWPQRDTSGHWQASVRGLPWSSIIGAEVPRVLPFGAIDPDQLNLLELKLHDQPFFIRDRITEMNLPEDFIVVLDAPAGAAIFTQQALNACNVAVLTLLADAGSYLSLPASMELLHKHCSPRINFINCLYVLNQADSSRELSNDVLKILKRRVAGQSIVTIHRDQAIAEALAAGQNVMTYAPECLGARDMMNAVSALDHLLLGVAA